VTEESASGEETWWRPSGWETLVGGGLALGDGALPDDARSLVLVVLMAFWGVRWRPSLRVSHSCLPVHVPQLQCRRRRVH